MAIQKELEPSSIGNLDSEQFLNSIIQLYGIKRIYYPGCLYDVISLEGPFEKEQIIYIDYDPEIASSPRSQWGGRNLIIADAAQPPFQEGCFDAVFIQDIHAFEDEFNGIVDVLKPGGILIFSTDGCEGDWGIQLQDVAKRPILTKLTLPFSSSFYTAFQKH